MLLFHRLIFLEFGLQGCESEVDSLLERIGSLGGKEICACKVDLYTGLLIHGGLWFHEGKVDVYIVYSLEAAGEFIDFLVDEGYEFLRDVEMDCFDVYFHNIRIYG